MSRMLGIVVREQPQNSKYMVRLQGIETSHFMTLWFIKAPERMPIGLCAFLIVANLLQQKEGIFNN